jgi:hypothetical protein
VALHCSISISQESREVELQKTSNPIFECLDELRCLGAWFIGQGINFEVLSGFLKRDAKVLGSNDT